MSNKRKQYSADFKAKVALAAFRGDKTVSELAVLLELPWLPLDMVLSH